MSLRVLIPPDVLRARVAALGAEISADYPHGAVLVAVLKGSTMFLADLVRSITVPVELDFLAVSSYAPGTGRVRLVKDLDRDITGADVVLVEDIVDTGLTLTYLHAELARRAPRSLTVCSLLDKRCRRIVPTVVQYAGFEIGDEFVLGYGLDYAERYRNLPFIGTLAPEVYGGNS